MKIQSIALILSLSIFSVNSIAESSGLRDINKIGCHLNDGTCFVEISGDSVGPESCKSVSVRWNQDTAASGTEMLSLLMAAFAAGKQVSFNIVESCYGTYPTFSYINIYK